MTKPKMPAEVAEGFQFGLGRAVTAEIVEEAVYHLLRVPPKEDLPSEAGAEVTWAILSVGTASVFTCRFAISIHREGCRRV